MKIDNPAFDYDNRGEQYSGQRKTEPRIAEYVYKALGDARTVLNVGAGSGSYEPGDRYVVAVEPSVAMRNQRIANGKAPAINAYGDQLPFDDRAFDAVTAFVTIHHWPDMKKGLLELKRVARDKVIIMTFDPQSLDRLYPGFDASGYRQTAGGRPCFRRVGSSVWVLSNAAIVHLCFAPGYL